MSSSGKLGHARFNSENIPAGVENNAYDLCENYNSFLGEVRGIFWALQQVRCQCAGFKLHCGPTVSQ